MTIWRRVQLYTTKIAKLDEMCLENENGRVLRNVHDMYMKNYTHCASSDSDMDSISKRQTAR